MKNNAELIEAAAACVKCGSCKAQCPTYDIDRTEGMSARGRVVLSRALLAGELPPTALMGQRLYSCLMCGVCEPTCPVSVPITEILASAMAVLGGRGYGSPLSRFGMSVALDNPGVLLALGRPLAPLARVLGILPPGMSPEWSPLSIKAEPVSPLRGRVAIFMGCAVKYTMQGTGRALFGLLQSLGYEPVPVPGETCCGAPHVSMGMGAEAEAALAHNTASIESMTKSMPEIKALLSLCPTCTLTLRRGLGPSHTLKAMDLSEFLSKEARLADLAGARPLKGQRVIYHDPCHLAYGLGVRTAPRAILQALGIEPGAAPAEPTCCGLSQRNNNPHIADALREKLADRYGSADTVITNCPGCLAEISRIHPHAIHLADIIKPIRD